MSWTDERVEKLKELWAEGMSASQIAKALGGVTRNAVIGKVHRLGLSNRGNAPAGNGAAAEAPVEAKPEPRAATNTRAAPPAEEDRAAEKPGAQAAPSAGPRAAQSNGTAQPAALAPRDLTVPAPPGPPSPDEEAARATLAEIEKMSRNLTLLELTERTCKWPIGDPTDENFRFCGLPCVPGKPYCQHHVAVAFQPMSTRRDRARASR